MHKEVLFQPAWVTAPGDTVREIMALRRISKAELAKRLGTSLSVVDGLSTGGTPIDPPLAKALQAALGPSAQFWMMREKQFRADEVRLSAQDHAITDQEWVSHLPVRDMVKFGWIDAPSRFADRLERCKRFFGVTDAVEWQRKYRGILSVAAFRMSVPEAAHPGAVSAWLRWAELKSLEIDCKAWDAIRFKQILPEIRALTRLKEPSTFLPILTRKCADCGVALVIAPAPSGCRASGATLFVSPEKALVILSFRYKSDDQFWFTFFHEAGHLILHTADAFFLEDGSEATADEEAEANEFAARTLLPSEFLPDLLKIRLETREVIRLAVRAGISPGIVVGQLQHMGRIGHNRLNGLKRRYKWNAAVGSFSL